MKKLELVMILAAAAGAAVTGSYPEAAAIVLLCLGFKWLEKQLEARSREQIAGSALMEAESGWNYENAVSVPTRLEQFTARFAKIFTPAMAAAAAVTALAGSAATGDRSYWIRTACTFLIIGCTGTLVRSIPLAFRCGIAAGSVRRILFKNGNAMEKISDMKLVAMGKSGILTDGQYGLQRVVPAIVFDEDEEEAESQEKESEEELILRLCAGAASGTSHPAVPGIMRGAEAWKLHPDRPEQVLESTEEGGCAKLPEGIVCFGTRTYLQKKNIPVPAPVQAYGMQILVALDGEHIGTLILADRVKNGAERLVQAARHVGVRTAILTEESNLNAETVGKQLNIDLIRAGLSPEQKVEAMKDLRRKVGGTFYLGSGKRDAAVMACADVSGTLGSGTAEAVEAADIVYAGNELKPMEISIDLSFVTTRIASENILLSVLVKAGVVFLGFVGYANLWLTIVADIGVTVICIINAVRILYFGKYRLRRQTGSGKK